MSNTDKATARPWIVTPDGFRIWSEDAGRTVGFTASNPGGRTDQARADARLIVQAVNAHYALLECCKAVRDWRRGGATVTEYMALIDQINAAIALAEIEDAG